jgi:CHAT domain-containing protein
VEGLIETDRAAEAFHVLERGRARSFLALLAERDLRLAELPPELAAERRQVNARYDRVQSRLAALSAGRDDAEIERLMGELRDLRNRQDEIFVRIRRESPRSAALENPEPLNLAEARAALDPGTVLLEYAVGKGRTWLFAVRPASADGSALAVFHIAIGAEELRDEVESFRRLLKDPGSSVAELRIQARRLYDLLVRPAEAQIAAARRILVSADGPLHALAFAALMREDRYLVEWRPLHSVLSATVYAELAKSRPSEGTPGNDRLIAFGDPVYPSLTAEAAGDPEVREAVRRGLALQPLPASGREVKSIAGLYPGARVYVGRDATEERAKSIGTESRLVHFACHGVIDERFPLNSALALTVPEKPAEGQDNGLLQAWEIFESLRLDADLVTLSACDTALGREMAGEGLVGLTRAFQYAGARSVLATLWGVSDLSTAGFMERFYGHLRRGVPKDEALRTAQIERLREQDGFSHPFHWAAFQLTGDWR